MFRLFGTRQYPAGPSFTRARQNEINMSGTQLRFSCPPSTSRLVDPQVYEHEYNIYDDSLYLHHLKTDLAVPYIPCFESGWGYYGWPLIDGEIGNLLFHIMINKHPSEDNLFSKAGFERAIDYDINYSWGPESSIGGERRFCYCPVNWRVRTYSGVEWVRYDMLPVTQSPITYWVTPITEQHYLMFSFDCNEKKEGVWVALSGLSVAFERMIENILNSVELDFSPDAQRAMAEAERMWPDQKYSESRQAFEWPEYKNRPKSEAEKFYDDMIKYSTKKP